jgi:hypothetical protein
MNLSSNQEIPAFAGITHRNDTAVDILRA